MAGQTTGLRRLSRYLILSFLACLAGTKLLWAEETTGWSKLAPGIEYQDLQASLLTPWSHIHVFRVDLKYNQLALVKAKALKTQAASIQQLAKFSQALIAINGGFFDQNFKQLGLRINDYKVESPFKPISWWGVFYVVQDRPFIEAAKKFQARGPIHFAIQSGPRLLVDGQIPPLKPGNAERSALGITSDGRVIILVTDNQALSTTELAHLMKNPPLNCSDALNLDGGSSSQLQASMNHFNLSVHGFSHISDAIIVKAK